MSEAEDKADRLAESLWGAWECELHRPFVRIVYPIVSFAPELLEGDLRPKDTKGEDE